MQGARKLIVALAGIVATVALPLAGAGVGAPEEAIGSALWAVVAIVAAYGGANVGEWFTRRPGAPKA